MVLELVAPSLATNLRMVSGHQCTPIAHDSASSGFDFSSVMRISLLRLISAIGCEAPWQISSHYRPSKA
ncbi:hypothetical protein DL89DRAFT_264179 [Linderina pennispora]|uniref:Uncharacterized protein n=1 Tax=Linderina pennispora TaxID=61395 RepID=A0A1Y1WLS8_9FUNG|nr:uncharacterized protein DL89DRAFT_264179 [Linderina pennispora]ORX74258.1 hypothetical protein DL89DRAFT_264179 [Linderina pennispora]